jgi:hypothetical protein
MKTVYFLILLLVPNWLKGQTDDTLFLMYKRVIGRGFSSKTPDSLSRKTVSTMIYNLKGTESNYSQLSQVETYDTVFFCSSLFILKKQNAYTSDLNIIGTKLKKKVKLRFQRIRNEIIIDGERKLKGLIITDSIFTRKINKDTTIDFLLVPIISGLPQISFKGQLIDNTDGSKMIFTGYTKDKVMRGTEFIHNTPNLDDVHFGMTNYSISKETHLAYFAGSEKLSQLLDISSDTILTFNLFAPQLRINDTILQRRQLIRRDLPKIQFMQKIYQILQGEWIMKSGIVIDDTTYSQNHLNSCIYKFLYQKNKLVIERSFVNNQFQNSSDTLVYSLNPTGDFISDENNKRPSDIILRKLSEDNATFIFVDQWVKNENSKSVKLLLEMRKQ